jgi:hypothetical protein
VVITKEMQLADILSAPSPAPIQTESSPASYARLLPKILAVDPGKLVHINLDVMVVVTTVVGCAKKLQALRPLLLEKLKDFDVEAFDDLDDYARALQHAHGLYIQATRPPGALQELVNRATALRDVLHADVLALAKRGLLNPESFKDVKHVSGYRALILDLQVLVATLRAEWSRVEGRTAVRAEELDSAVLLIDTLTEAVGTKEQSPEKAEEIKRIRKNAYALLLFTYDEIRSAVAYVRRREGDVDSIMPSLYAGRLSGAKEGAGETEPGQPPAEQPATPAESGVMPPVAADPGSVPAATPPFRRTQ